MNCHGIYENCLSSGDIICIMSVFLSKGHHPNCIQNIFNFSEPLLHSVLHIQLFYFGSENGIFFQNWMAILTANIISVSKGKPLCKFLGTVLVEEIKCRLFCVSIIVFLGLEFLSFFYWGFASVLSESSATVQQNQHWETPENPRI